MYRGEEQDGEIILAISSNSSDNPAEAGLILVADVVDFSDKTGQEQRQVILKLLDFLKQKHLLLSSKRRAERDLSLDRLVVASPHKDYQETLDFAHKLIQYMSTEESPVNMRVGLHDGNFVRILKPDGQSHLVTGTGPNICARIARIADPRQIIVSEEFVQSWFREHGKEVYQRLVPGESKPPIEFFLKKNVLQQIRIYLPSGSPRDEAIPRLLASRQVAEIQLKEKVLPALEAVFMTMLNFWEASSTRRTVSPRVSIWVPVPGGECLESTTFRYIHNRYRTTTISSVHTQTSYRLDGDGQGPPGRAFMKASPQVLHKLPDYRRSPDKYIQRLREWDVPETVVRSFTRHAKAFIAFPFGLEDLGNAESPKPEGIVCIDTVSALRTFNEDTLLHVATSLMTDYGLLIAALWRLRV